MIALWLMLCLAFIPFSGGAYAQPAMDMDSPCEQCLQSFAAGHQGVSCNQLDCFSTVCIGAAQTLNIMSDVLLASRFDLASQKILASSPPYYQSPDSTRLIRPPIA